MPKKHLAECLCLPKWTKKLLHGAVGGQINTLKISRSSSMSKTEYQTELKRLQQLEQELSEIQDCETIRAKKIRDELIKEVGPERAKRTQAMLDTAKSADKFMEGFLEK